MFAIPQSLYILYALLWTNSKVWIFSELLANVAGLLGCSFQFCDCILDLLLNSLDELLDVNP